MTNSIFFNESDSYYSMADATELTLQDGPWVVFFSCLILDNTGSNYQYIISNNNFNVNNSMNIYMVEASEGSGDVNKMKIRTVDGDGTNIDLVSSVASGAAGVWEWYFVQRNTTDNEIQVYRVLEGGSATKVASTSDASFNAVNGGLWNIGRRVDGNSVRYFGGYIAQMGKGDISLTTTQMENIANGDHPIDDLSLSLDVYLDLDSATTTLTDQTGNGNTATRNGTCYNGFGPFSTSMTVFDVGDDTDILPATDAAFDSAEDGYTVNFPAGDFDFGTDSTRSLETTKKVSLQGQGATYSGTIIKRPETISDSNLGAGDEMIQLTINATGDSGMVIDGIWFKSKRPKFSTAASDTGSSAGDRCLRIKKAPGTVVKNCRFTWFGYSGLEVTHYISGSTFENVDYLVTNNIFDHCVKVDNTVDNVTFGYGIEVYGENENDPWDGTYDPPTYGASHFVFIERNLFLESRHGITSNTNAIYCSRHNTFLNFFLNQAIDFHGTTTSSSTAGLNGTLGTEIYENLIVNTAWNNSGTDPDYQDYWRYDPDTSAPVNVAYRSIGARGGESWIHNNESRGYQYAIGMRSDNSAACWCQIGFQSISSGCGTGATARIGDLFHYDTTWDILISGVANGGSMKNDAANFVEDRDFHNADYSSITSYSEYTYPHPDGPAVTASRVYTTELTSLWLFDNTADDERNNNDLTASGATYASGVKKFGTHSLELSGAEYVSISDASHSGLNPESFTGGAWVRFKSVSAEQNIMGKYDFGDNNRSYRVGIQTSNGNTYWILTVSEGGTSTRYDIVYDPPEVDTWYHLAYSFDNTTGLLRLYIDGQLVNCRWTEYTTNFSSAADFVIGAIETSSTKINYFDGYVDNAFFTDTVFVDSQVYGIFENGFYTQDTKSYTLQATLANQTLSASYVLQANLTKTETDSFVLQTILKSQAQTQDFVLQATLTSSTQTVIHTLQTILESQAQTQTFTLQTILVNQAQTQTHILQTNLTKTETDTFVLQAVLESQAQTQTFTLQTVLVNQAQTQTHILQTNLTKTETDTFVLQAVLESQAQTQTFTLQTILVNQAQTRTFALQTNLTKTETDTFALQTNLTKTETKAFVLQANLSRTISTVLQTTLKAEAQTQTYVFQASLTAGISRNIKLQAILKKQEITQTFALQTILAKTETISFALQTNLTKTETSTFALQSILKKQEITRSFVLQTIIESQTQTSTFTLQTILAKTQTDSFVLQTNLTKTETTSFALQAILKEQAITQDFVLLSVLAKTQTETFALQSVLAKTETTSFVLQTNLTNTETTSFVLQTVLAKTETSSFALQTIIEAQAVTRTFELQTNLTKTETSTFALQAILKAQAQTQDFALQSILQKTNSLAFVLNLDLIRVQKAYVMKISLVAPFVRVIGMIGGYDLTDELEGEYDISISFVGEYNSNDVESLEGGFK